MCIDCIELTHILFIIIFDSGYGFKFIYDGQQGKQHLQNGSKKTNQHFKDRQNFEGMHI